MSTVNLELQILKIKNGEFTAIVDGLEIDGIFSLEILEEDETVVTDVEAFIASTNVLIAGMPTLVSQIQSELQEWADYNAYELWQDKMSDLAERIADAAQDR